MVLRLPLLCARNRCTAVLLGMPFEAPQPDYTQSLNAANTQRVTS